MKTILFALVALAIWTAPAIAQETAPPQTQAQIAVDINQYIPDNTSGFVTPAYVRAVLHIMNASAVNVTGNSVFSFPLVYTNVAAIKAATITLPNVLVQTQGYTTAGDGGGATYLTSVQNCVAADNGSQIQPSGAGCYYAQFPSSGASPLQFGAKGDGSTVDTTAVQNIMNYGGNIQLGNHIYNVGALTCSKTIRMIGAQNWGTNTSGAVTSGFNAAATNQNTFTIQSGCSGSSFENFGINAAAAGTNTSGSQFNMSGVPSQVVLHYIGITGAYIGVDLSGNSVTLDHILLAQVTGGYGIRIGYYTTNGVTVDPRIEGSTIQCNSTTPAQAGIQILDAGGFLISHTDNLYCTNGFQVFPGAGQYVQFGVIGDTYLADTTVGSGYVIDSNGGTVKSINFTSDWSSAYTSTSTNPNLWIKQTSGTVTGVHFTGHRILNVPATAVRIDGGTDISFNDSRICGANALNSTYNGVEIASGVHGVSIKNSEIGAACEAQAGHNIYNIKLLGSNYGIEIENNNLSSFTTGPISGAPVGGQAQSNVIVNNLGVDDSLYAIAAASSVDFGSYDSVGLTGSSTTISTIANCWNGRTLVIRSTNSQTFATGGNISNNFVSPANVPFMAQCQNSYWYVYGLPGFTQGSIAFGGASGLTQDNSEFYWDDTHFTLGIGTASPYTTNGSLPGEAVSFSNATGVRRTVQNTTSGGAAQESWSTYTSNSYVILSLFDTASPYMQFSFGSGVKAFQASLPLQSTAYNYSTPTTGGTVTIGDQQDDAIVDPAGGLATLTVNLPTCSSVYDGKRSVISTTQTITTLTVGATAGTVLNAPTTLAAGAGIAFKCRGAGPKWYRQQ